MTFTYSDAATEPQMRIRDPLLCTQTARFLPVIALDEARSELDAGLSVFSSLLLLAQGSIARAPVAVVDMIAAILHEQRGLHVLG